MSWITPRRLGVALVASFAVNLFLAGFLIGGWAIQPRPVVFGALVGPLPALWSPPWIRHVLGTEAEPVVEKVAGRHRDRMEKSIKAFRDARNEVRRRLAADPFDVDALAGSLDTLGDAVDAAQRESYGATVDLAKQLTLDQRRRLADAASWGRHGMPGHSPFAAR